MPCRYFGNAQTSRSQHIGEGELRLRRRFRESITFRRSSRRLGSKYRGPRSEPAE